MVALLDIAEVKETIEVAGKKGKKQSIDVYGISIKGIAYLFKKFPELRMLMTGQEVGRDRLIELAPEAIAAIIACSLGAPEDQDTEQWAARLPLELQLDIVEASLKLTMPQGIAPFVKRLESLAKLVGGVAVSTKVPDSNLPLA